MVVGGLSEGRREGEGEMEGELELGFQTSAARGLVPHEPERIVERSLLRIR